MVLREVASVTAAGIVIGMALIWGTSRYVESFVKQSVFGWLRGLSPDVRLAVRMLHRTKSVSLPAIVVLALGIGTARSR
jgi:hypothetical protein